MIERELRAVQEGPVDIGEGVAEVASRAPATDATAELEGIADFIYTRTS